MTDKDAYQQKAEAKLREWQADIDKLRAQADQVTADARIEYDRQIARLVEQQKAASQQFAKMQKASGDAWADMKAGMEKSWAEMSQAMRDAMRRFG